MKVSLGAQTRMDGGEGSRWRVGVQSLDSTSEEVNLR